MNESDPDAIDTGVARDPRRGGHSKGEAVLRVFVSSGLVIIGWIVAIVSSANRSMVPARDQISGLTHLEFLIFAGVLAIFLPLVAVTLGHRQAKRDPLRSEIGLVGSFIAFVLGSVTVGPAIINAVIELVAVNGRG